MRLLSRETAIGNRRSVTAGSSQAAVAHALWSVARFALLTLLLSALLSLILTPVVHLSWLKVVRRCVSVGAMGSLLICLRKEGKAFGSYGLSRFKQGRGWLGVGLFLGVIGLGVMLLIGLLTGACDIDIHPDPVRLWATLLGFIPASILVGMLEELIFRGFLLQQLEPISRKGAWAVSSLLYALVHLKQRSLTTEGWMELMGLFLLGSVLAWCYFQTGQLWLGIGLHASLAYGARVNKLLIAFPDTSKSWLVGTSRLINGLSAWLALLVVAFLAWTWVKRVQRRGVAL